jgi:hypothetical protein
LWHRCKTYFPRDTINFMFCPVLCLYSFSSMPVHSPVICTVWMCRGIYMGYGLNDRVLYIIYTRAVVKFVDSSSYYSESKLCGGAKYVPWQTMHFLQRSTHFSKTCCRPFAASFKRIVEQALPLRGSPFTFVSPSLKRFHHLKTAVRLIASSP